MAGNEIIDVRMAKLTITYASQQGDLQDYVPYDTPDNIVKDIATEALRGGVPGIDPVEANLADFVVDRFDARPDIPYPRLAIRPKTPFGC